MMSRSNLVRRPLRASAVVALVAGSLTLLGVAPASANASGVFFACGDGATVGAPALTPSGCESLTDALTDANAFSLAHASPVTVRLMPGTYCPVTIPADAQRMTIVGVGAAGIDTSGGPASYTGPEAALSSIVWDASCGASPPNDAFINAAHNPQLEADLFIENIAVVGAAGGPANGITLDSVGLNLRDVLVKNFTGTGMTFSNNEGYDGYQMQINNSAFLSNGTGVSFSGEGSIDESTMASNTGDGLHVVGDIHLDNDTIALNHNGVDFQGFGNQSQSENSIVVDNSTADCAGTVGDWETGFSQKNILGSTCNTSNASDFNNSVDTVAAAALNGGPTPTILPPADAVAAAPGLCNSTGSDQREYPQTSSIANCDIGAVNTSNSISAVAPAASPDPVAFGTVPTNEPASLSVTISNGGGDVMGISSVSTTGTGYSIVGDGCTYFLLIHQQNAAYCIVSVQAAPPTEGVESDGTLVVQTTTHGEFDVPLTAMGGTPIAAPSAPTNVQGSAGNQHINLSWTAPTDDGGQAVQEYDIRYSTDGGSTYTDGPTTSDTSTNISSLTNGTPYLFEVAADNGVLVSDWSAPSAALTPHAPSDGSAVTAPTAVTIKAGGKTTLSTTLTDASTHAALSGLSISLTQRAAGASAFTAVGSPVTTNAQGVAFETVHPTSNTNYRWSFAGSGIHRAVTSALGKVSVAQVVHAVLQHKKLKHGRIDKIYGTVSPDESNRSVTLERLVSGTWKPLGIQALIHNQTLPNHKRQVGYVLSYTPKKKGPETLRVVRAATSANAAGNSRRLKVKVT